MGGRDFRIPSLSLSGPADFAESNARQSGGLLPIPQQSFLRLASTPSLLKVYGAEGLTNRDALVALDTSLALPQVCEREEAPGVPVLWHRWHPATRHHRKRGWTPALPPLR